MAEPIDTGLSGLCEAVREDLLRKEDRSRQRRRVDAARELDLKPGTDLGGLFRRFEELSVEDRAGFELLIGAQMLQYCLSTRAGNLLGVVAAAEGKDPYEVVANLIARQANKKTEATERGNFVTQGNEKPPHGKTGKPKGRAGSVRTRRTEAEGEVMRIAGFTEDQIAALCEMWKLRTPIDVIGFFVRADIPKDAKEQVRRAGIVQGRDIQAEAESYRNMQAQIVIEVAKLDKERWNPLGSG